MNHYGCAPTCRFQTAGVVLDRLFFFFFFPKVRAGKGLIIGAQTKTFSICLYSSLSVYVWKRV